MSRQAWVSAFLTAAILWSIGTMALLVIRELVRSDDDRGWVTTAGNHP
jgi:hypothetical protein